MMTYDNSCYEGEFAGITQLQGKVSSLEDMRHFDFLKVNLYKVKKCL